MIERRGIVLDRSLERKSERRVSSNQNSVSNPFLVPVSHVMFRYERHVILFGINSLE